MIDDRESDEITRPVRVTATIDQGNYSATAADDELQVKQPTIPEWLIEFAQQPATETAQDPDSAFVDDVYMDDQSEIAAPIPPETSGWQPLQDELETENEDLNKQRDFKFSDVDTLLDNNDYAQLYDYLKPMHLEAEEKASLIIKIRSHLLLDEQSSCLWELYEKLH